MAEYADLRGLQDACVDLIDDPSMFHAAAEVIVETAIHFARRQAQAGCEVPPGTPIANMEALGRASEAQV